MHDDIAHLLTTRPVRLSYTVHSASGYNPAFPPDKIAVDCPTDENSRWTSPTPEERKRERRSLDQFKATSQSSSPTSAQTRGRVTLNKGESEWVLIELDQLCLVNLVGFGKYTKAHPCNLAEFSIHGGISPEANSMEPLVKSGFLKNDANTEKVSLPIELDTEARETTVFPVKYLRIDCHEAANASYSVSIWHLFLEGFLLSSPLDSIALDSLNHYRASSTAHLILSHLRRQGPSTLPTFSSYLSTLPPTISTSFEHPSLSKLHQALVIEGDFEKSERVLEEECLRKGLFREWSFEPTSTCSGVHESGKEEKRKRKQTKKKGKTIAKWERLDTLIGGGGGGGGATAKPGPRGGHQMVRVGRKLLLFGGWDGKKDLGDLWEWELPRDSPSEGARTGGDEGQWRCISTGEEEDGELRPGKRSCHQLAVDESEGWVYLLGARRDEEVPEDWEERVANTTSSGGSNGPDAMDLEGGEETGDNTRSSNETSQEDRWKSDFWRYKAVGPGRGKWDLLSKDTRNEGGPALLFDHAMVVHAATQRLFVFGGKWQPYDEASAEDSTGAATASSPSSQYSGMYCYDIKARKWSHLFGDPATGSTPASFLTDRLVPRAGHSMLLDTTLRYATIYVYGGQRDTRYENDLWAIRLATPRSNEHDLGEEEEEEDGDAADSREDESRLWRQGVVLDAPRRAVARSLVDASLLPVSPESSPSRNPSASTPTILQIRRISIKNDPDSVSPPAAFTPRLSLASNRSMTLVTGLTRTGTGSSMMEVPLEGIWRKARGESGGWEKIEEWSATGSARDEERKPTSRFASQVVYDPLRNEHYMFGGHPHDPADPETRLSDFWKLKIIDPTPGEALRMTKFLIRKQRFNEMCTSVPTVFALQYLQNDLSSVVDHSSPSESTAFRSCMTALLSAPPQNNIDVPLLDEGSGELPRLSEGTGGGEEARYRERHDLFEELMDFFPKSERQPVERLDQVGRLLRSAR